VSESGSAIRIDSAKDFPMEPVETGAAAKMFEATSSFGIVLTFLASTIYCVLPRHNIVAGVPPLGASTSREPTDLPDESRGDMSTSIAANAAVLDALYGDLPLIGLSQPKEQRLKGQ